jgi:BirA family biotin operon repressor/biotin-[acetyl-CoA-carboxylase] ligase
MKSKILEYLQDTESDYLSGEAMSEMLGVSRAAIWKVIHQLREEGYEIEAVPRKGYRLIHQPDRLSPDCLAPYLQPENSIQPLIHFASISSTNDYAKSIALESEEGTIVIADEQTKGRGRRGRNWHSPANQNIYLSVILKPDLPIHRVPMFTQMAAAAVWEALSPDLPGLSIKWPNDLLFEGRKICGILTEMSGEMHALHYLVIGIGINVNTTQEDFPEDLQSIASSLRIETGEPRSRQQLAAHVIERLTYHYKQVIKTGSFETILDICRDHSSLLGETINIHTRDSVEPARAIQIDSDGRLVVETSSGVQHLSSGEVSIRKT